MGTFKQFLSDQKLEPKTLVRLSSQLESRSEEDRKLAKQRSDKRRDKEKQGKPYAELGIGKPKSGRGVSVQQVNAALEDQPLPAKVRGKLVRAVNAVLSKKGGPPADFKSLFGEVPVRKGTAAKAS
ncbi:hypothetical protein JQX13_48385 [Archangium violaceum]|uniref:hypothetical protein n=1 Tax=Archangium violaceum TaxID=83451 RepID=UPI00193C562B|nr:hypothetical protein [Archangium violaceum]QRK07725.1 hypothetical protein JQX13_48385 [Archangium violaceum]